MAHDKSEPKIGLIVQIALVAIVTVLAIRIGLVSYFGWMNDKEHYVKVASQKPQQLLDLREEEQKALSGGAMPIASSMKLIVADKRNVPGLEPKAADPLREKDTMAGWAQMPKPVDETPVEDAAAPAPPSSAAVGDAAPASDAATKATDAAAADAGAPAPKQGEHHG